MLCSDRKLVPVKSGDFFRPGAGLGAQYSDEERSLTNYADQSNRSHNYRRFSAPGFMQQASPPRQYVSCSLSLTSTLAAMVSRQMR